MRKWLKRVAIAASALVGAVLLVYAAAWQHAERAQARTYPVEDPPLVFAGDDAEAAHGAHLYAVLGCVDCHGPAAEGRLVIEGGPMGRVVGPNLTPAAVGSRYDADTLAAAIRHGVGPGGRPLRFMPSGEFSNLSDADTAAIVRHLQSLPPSDTQPGETVLGPLGRVLFLFGKLEWFPAEHIDHRPRARVAPVAAPTAEYGAYLAQVCTGCHGKDWAGQRVAGTPPEIPAASNLTPHANGLRGWTEADFLRLIREGQRPDGGTVHGMMPWRIYAGMTDDELRAIWLHLSSLPPLPGESKS
jgi:cytochrome c553